MCLTGSILNDDSHTLISHIEFQLLPPGEKLIVPKCRTKYWNNFVTAALLIHTG